MGLFSWVSGQFVDVIEWLDDSNDTMVWRFPRNGNEIKYGAKLTVRESQIAVFINEGEIADIMTPGIYELETKNLPILTNLQSWKHGFESPFKAEVYFINTRRFTNLKWGTKNPIMVRDPEFSMVRLRAFGTYEIRVNDAETFLKEIVGTDGHFMVDEIDDQLSNLITSKLAVVLGQDETPALDLAGNYEVFGQHIRDGIAPYFEEYGLELSKILVENISLPEDVEKAMDKRTSRAITGNLDDHLKYQMAESMANGANGNSAMSEMAGMGAGMAMGQQIAASLSRGNQNTQQAAHSSPPGGMPPPPPPQESYFVSLNSQTTGPYSHDKLIQMILNNTLTKDTFVWKEGFSSWQKAGEALSSLFQKTPPPIG